jgi:hypothetical protein
MNPGINVENMLIIIFGGGGDYYAIFVKDFLGESRKSKGA